MNSRENRAHYLGRGPYRGYKCSVLSPSGPKTFLCLGWFAMHGLGLRIFKV